MIRLFREWRRRRARRLFVEHAHAFDEAARRLPMPELLALFMGHVARRAELRHAADIRNLGHGFGQYADQLEREARFYGSQALGEEALR